MASDIFYTVILLVCKIKGDLRAHKEFLGTHPVMLTPEFMLLMTVQFSFPRNYDEILESMVE